MSFNPGDKVVVNGNRIATIESYDEGTNLVIYRADLPGGGHDTVTSPITHTRLELFAPRETPFENEPEAAAEPAKDDKAK